MILLRDSLFCCIGATSRDQRLDIKKYKQLSTDKPPYKAFVGQELC